MTVKYQKYFCNRCQQNIHCQPKMVRCHKLSTDVSTMCIVLLKFLARALHNICSNNSIEKRNWLASLAAAQNLETAAV